MVDDTTIQLDLPEPHKHLYDGVHLEVQLEALRPLIQSMFDSKFATVKLPPRVPLYFDFVTDAKYLQVLDLKAREMLYQELSNADSTIYRGMHSLCRTRVITFNVATAYGQYILRLTGTDEHRRIQGYPRGGAVYDGTARDSFYNDFMIRDALYHSVRGMSDKYGFDFDTMYTEI